MVKIDSDYEVYSKGPITDVQYQRLRMLVSTLQDENSKLRKQILAATREMKEARKENIKMNEQLIAKIKSLL